MTGTLDGAIEVAKFGGSSLADQPRRRNVRGIVLGTYDEIVRRDIVVSSNGRKYHNSEKPSDVLEWLGRRNEDNSKSNARLDDVIGIFREVAKEGGLTKLLVGPHAGQRYEEFVANELRWRYGTRGQISPEAHEVLMIAVGEFFMTHIMADSLAELGMHVRLLLPETMPFKFTGPIKDAHVPNQSIDALVNALGGLEVFNVMPGYYGVHVDEKGNAQTLRSWDGYPRYVLAALGRGGSDTTAQYLTVARLRWLRANGYNNTQVIHSNFTDVNGIAVADPRLIPDVAYNKFMSYDDAIALGASVVHPRVYGVAKEHDTPLLIRRSFAPDENGGFLRGFDPQEPGTLVKMQCSEEDYAQNPNPNLVGINYKQAEKSLVIAGPRINTNHQIRQGIESVLLTIRVASMTTSEGNNYLQFSIPDSSVAQKAVKLLYNEFFRRA